MRKPAGPSPFVSRSIAAAWLWAVPAVALANSDFAITKTGPKAATPGQDLVYTIVVTNLGPDTADATVDDPTPSGLAFVSNSGACLTAFPCALGSLAASETRTITARFSVPGDYAGADLISNTAAVTTTGSDPAPANNSATADSALIRVTGFHTLVPCRIVDTRGVTGVPIGGPALAAGAARPLAVRRECGLPDTAIAISLNVTVTSPTGSGDLRIYAGGGAAPLASVINYSAGQTRANNAIVSLGPDGSLGVQCDQASGTVQMILDVNGYFTSTDAVETPMGQRVAVRPAPEVEITFDEVTVPGETTAMVVTFPDNRPGAVDQDLRDFFAPGSPLRALLPSVVVPSYVAALGLGSAAGTPTFVLSIVDTTAKFRRTAEFHGLEDFRLGWDPPCVVLADPTQEPRTFYAREAFKGEPALVEESAFGGPAFVDISSGCGSNKGSGWNFSLYLTGRDTRTPAQIATFMLQRLQDALTALAGSITNPTVATSLANEVTAALAAVGATPASASANMSSFIGIVDANPSAFDDSTRNVSGELVGRALSARYMISKLVPSGSFAEFPVPAPSGKWPFGIASGPDGNLWFTETFGAKIGRITPAGVITEFGPTGGQPVGITLGSDGNLWYAEHTGQRIGRITPAGTITAFNVPSASYPYGITTGPDGNVWYTGYFGNKIGKVTPAGTITEFPVPGTSASPAFITPGPDGNLWFTAVSGNRIGRITTTGVVTEFPVPTAGSGPRGIAAGPDGNLWFVETTGNKVGRITPGGVITEFPIPTAGSQPWLIARGADGNLWFTEQNGNKIGRITTDGVITEFAIPTASSRPYDITAGPDGNLWFTEDGGNKIGRLAP